MTSPLAARTRGPVFARGDTGFAEELAGYNTAVTHAPDLVVGATSAHDIAETVAFAREHGAHMSVLCTGHGTFAPITSGIVVSTRRMHDVAIDPLTRTALIGAGARWEHVITAAAGEGLAPPGGSSPTVGVVGYLLGGGLGPFARSHGFGSDYAAGFGVVTGTGEHLEVDAEHHPDLFWALRGGKHGLGIVTHVRIRLIELRTIYAGFLTFDEPHIETALHQWIDWTQSAPADVSTSVSIVRIRGRRIMNMRFAYPGPPAEGEQRAAALRAFAPVHKDALAPLAAADVGLIHNDPREPRAVWIRGMLLTHADRDFASRLLQHVGSGVDTPILAAEIRHIGEATSRDVRSTSAVGGRSANFTLGFAGVPDPELFEAELPAAVERAMASLHPWISPETNINFTGRIRSPEHLASAWTPAILAKLADVRRHYDPDGIFSQ